MVYITFTKQERKALHKGSILLRMLTLEYPCKNSNTDQLLIELALSVRYWHERAVFQSVGVWAADWQRR